MNQPPITARDIRAAEQRSATEPTLEGHQLHTRFPELQHTTHGSSRAKGTVRIILRDYIGKPEIKAALTGKLARGITSPAHQNVGTSEGYPLMVDNGGLDGRHILQSYLDGAIGLDPEDVKGILFAIARECKRGSNGGHASLIALNDLASLAIFEIQQQRRIDTSTVQLKL